MSATKVEARFLMKDRRLVSVLTWAVERFSALGRGPFYNFYLSAGTALHKVKFWDLRLIDLM